MEHTKEWYNANMGQTVKVRRHTCTVAKYEKQSQSGSYERGFKFHTTIYAMLQKGTGWGAMYSFDGGQTWATQSAAYKSAGRSGKVMLERTTSKEFAFDAIQRINKEYDPNYKW